MPPMRDTEFARRLRHLRARVPEVDRVIAERAGIGRSAVWNFSHVSAAGTGTWLTAERLIKALGGDPEEYRAAWEDARKGVMLTSLEAVAIDIAAMGENLSSALAQIAPAALASGTAGNVPLAEYAPGVEYGRAGIWHAAGCGWKAFPADAAELLAGIVAHHQEAHAGG
jgi:hypothetical protein